jgi:hypothetical protein
LSGLYRIPADGGQAEVLTTLDSDQDEYLHGNPQMLAGGRTLLMAVSVGSLDSTRIEVLSLDTGRRKVLIEDGSFRVVYAASGHIVYGRDGTLIAAPFDLASLELTGPAVPVLSGVQMDPLNRIAFFALAPNGTLVYVPSGQGIGEGRLVWVDRQGEVETLRADSGLYFTPSISPDGKEAAVGMRKGSAMHLLLYDLQRQVPTQLTFEGLWNSQPVWSPDGTRIAFQSNVEGGHYGIFLIAADGAGTPERLIENVNMQRPASWSPDGTYLAYVDVDAEEQNDVWVMPMGEGNREPEPFLTSDYSEFCPKFSVDGRWIAYQSDESGRSEVYIKQFLPGSRGKGSKKQISSDGGLQPVWSRDGRELYFRDLDGVRLMAVTIRTEPRIEVGEPDTPPPPWWGSTAYDVAPDGRFLMISESESRRASMKLMVVLNWFEELKRLAPTE